MLKSALALSFVLAAQAVTAQPLNSERQRELRYMVKQDCGSCHGLTMKGGLGPALTPEALKGRTPEGLAVLILDGIPDTAMPPWRPLITEEEARWIGSELLKGLPQ